MFLLKEGNIRMIDNFGWGKAKQYEPFLGTDWYDPKSQPVKILVEQKTVTISSFFYKLGGKLLGLK